MYNFKVVACDTDSVFFKKLDQTPFTEEETEILLDKVNSLQPSKIRWELNGNFRKVITLKAKNYILDDGKKVKYKGSALKSSTLEPRFKDFLQEIIKAILEERNNYQEIYYKYVREINDIKDIKPYCSKKTLSATTYVSERANETKIIDAIQGSELVEGDKAYLYFKSDGSLNLVEKFDGDYDKDKYFEKLYKTAERFSTVLDSKTLFPNFKLKKNKVLLQEVINEL